jgi:hypothetical protein
MSFRHTYIGGGFNAVILPGVSSRTFALASQAGNSPSILTCPPDKSVKGGQI